MIRDPERWPRCHSFYLQVKTNQDGFIENWFILYYLFYNLRNTCSYYFDLSCFNDIKYISKTRKRKRVVVMVTLAFMVFVAVKDSDFSYFLIFRYRCASRQDSRRNKWTNFFENQSTAVPSWTQSQARTRFSTSGVFQDMPFQMDEEFVFLHLLWSAICRSC